jgi:glycosyltransferase involved in cell wall biosynthesis
LRIKTVITGTFNFYCPDADNDYFRRPWYEKIMIRYSVKNANINIFVSEKEMLLVKKHWNLKNCVYSPHIIQTDIYYPLETKERREDMLLSICWLQKANMRRKCIFEMIDVIEILLKKGYAIYYFIVGREGDGIVELREYIKIKKIEKNVMLLGEIDENKKISLMQECTAYFQITKYEGFGLAIAEAMACGAPVITSDVGEVTNVVGEGGVICNSYDVNKIVENVELLLKDKVTRKKLSRCARLQILEKYQYTRRFRDFERILTPHIDED